MEELDDLQLNPITGEMAPPKQTINRPIPSNQLGHSKPVFSPLANETGKQLFGTNPQEGLGLNAPLFDIERKKYNNKQ